MKERAHLGDLELFYIHHEDKAQSIVALLSTKEKPEVTHPLPR